MHILIESAVELESEQLTGITKILEKSFGKGVTVDTNVDSEVLGGLRITLNGSKRIDLSLLGKLDYVKKVLN